MKRNALALVTLALVQLIWALPAMGAGESFDDVSSDNIFAADIDWLAERGITTGCGDGVFCPNGNVTRGQMAAFLVRAFGYSDTGGITFTDTVGHIFENDIAKLARAGVTRGCNAAGDAFCPDQPVTRGQMAAFLTRAFGYYYEPGDDSFVDDDDSIFEDDIEKLAFAGVTTGCADNRFCPDDYVTRAQMAAFLRRAFRTEGGEEPTVTTTTTTTTTAVPMEPVAASTEIVSVDGDGNEGSAASYHAAISSNGRFVVFESEASALVDGDSNGVVDVFIHDRQAGITERVSVSDSEAQANGPSTGAWVSGDGRYVAFTSTASNLVTGDTSDSDVFVRDRQAGTTVLASVNTSEVQANGASRNASISDDGRYVLFQSRATNLVPNDTNGNTDVFLRDLARGETTRISLGAGGVQGNGGSGDPFITADGRYVIFQSGATNLVASDTNRAQDVFVKDRVANTLVRVSLSSGGTQGNDDSYGPTSISPDGRYVAFESDATNLVSGDTNGKRDIFVRDLQAGTTARASVTSSEAQGGGDSFAPVLSNGGRYVAFYSQAALVTDDTNNEFDIYLRDLVSGKTIRVNIPSAGGVPSGGNSYDPAISADGRFIAFHSNLNDLVPGDDNGVRDVFVRDVGVPSPTQ